MFRKYDSVFTALQLSLKERKRKVDSERDQEEKKNVIEGKEEAVRERWE
jgi:hypothetical protein